MLASNTTPKLLGWSNDRENTAEGLRKSFTEKRFKLMLSERTTDGQGLRPSDQRSPSFVFSQKEDSLGD